MKKKQKDYFKTNTILVVTELNKLVTLYTPIAVRFTNDVYKYKKSQIALVDLISIAENDKLIFKIGDKWFYYYHFEILCYSI
ncbi:hypothetical protein KUL156_54090 [Alteromonas sp. KUL156]|nr:hypothetical protein KUL154_10700 [Alteromonas sp. KUL154]GFE02817.1 hypothetical protein KUL156_54090 [Alteromonas sp. KUL156]